METTTRLISRAGAYANANDLIFEALPWLMTVLVASGCDGFVHTPVPVPKTSKTESINLGGFFEVSRAGVGQELDSKATGPYFVGLKIRYIVTDPKFVPDPKKPDPRKGLPEAVVVAYVESGSDVARFEYTGDGESNVTKTGHVRVIVGEPPPPGKILLMGNFKLTGKPGDQKTISFLVVPARLFRNADFSFKSSIPAADARAAALGNVVMETFKFK